MNLDFFKDIENNSKNIEVNELINELSRYLDDFKEKVNIKLSNKQQIIRNYNNTEQLLDEQNTKLNNLREENCLYRVIDRSQKGIYLQNTNNNEIFEELDIPKEIKDKIGNDYILRYKDDTYILEEELTNNFFESLIDISEYKKIQENFIKESNILEIDSNTRYKVLLHEKNYTILNYGKSQNNIIKVPNALLPYFMNEKTILYYENGKFNKDIEQKSEKE